MERLADADPIYDTVDATDAGLRSVRGGVYRVGGYIVGSALSAAAAVLLLRYLGVADFGRYVTVTSLVAIVVGLSDIGLMLVGQREYVLRSTEEERHRLTANILGIRLVVTPVAVGLSLLFCIAAGYESSVVIGTLIVGASVVIGNAALTFMVPLTAQLRFGALTAAEVGKQLVIVGGNALFVVLGAGLLAFFGVQVAGALVLLLLVAVFLGWRFLTWPRFSLPEWRVILREAAPMGAAVFLSVLYLRTLVVMASLLTSAVQTGLFATSYRVLEMITAVPGLMVGTAFPIMSRAGLDNQVRLRYVLQRLVETSLLVAVPLVLVLAIAAHPIVLILGGRAYSGSAAVLRIQSFALLGSFVSVVWTTALVAVRRQSDLLIINTVALVSVAALGGSLIPLFGATGAAIAAVVGEALLALVALAMLLRARPELTPDPRFALKVLIAGFAAAMFAFVPGVPALGKAALAVGVYAVVVVSVGAVPPEVFDALSRNAGRPAS
jgi:O-antigen/teichoic acid export membrane protein